MKEIGTDNIAPAGLEGILVFTVSCATLAFSVSCASLAYGYRVSESVILNQGGKFGDLFFPVCVRIAGVGD